MFVRLVLFACWGVIAFAQGGASIEGRVVSASGDPVRRATVSVRSMIGVQQMSGPNMPASAAAESDGEGHFVVQGLPGGAAVVTVSRAGYADANHQVTLGPTQRMTDVTLRMTRLGVMYGKVTDEYGDAFARVNVGMFRKVYENRWRWIQTASATTGPDGTYSIGDLQPGRYVVVAMDLLNGANNGGLPASRYIQTYYPSVSESGSATPINIGAEEEIRGVDIRMQKGRMYRVSGSITGGDTSQNTSVSLVARDSGGVEMLRLQASVNMKEGTFTFDHVPEGSYYVMVQMQTRPLKEIDATHPPINLMGREIVNVSGRDVENLTIPVTQGAEVAGRVRVDGTLPAAVQSRVELRSIDAFPSGEHSLASAADGTFKFSRVAAGSYQVAVTGLTNGYVASIRAEGQDVTWSPITVGSGGMGAIEVLVKTDPAKLSGVARDEKGDPLTETRVTLWPAGGKAGFVVAATTDRAGGFRFQNVPPGEYRVAAWDRKATVQWMYNTVIMAPEFLTQFDSTAATVRLSSSGEQTQDLNLIPQAAMEAALALLP